jgi:hypothetical protein
VLNRPLGGRLHDRDDPEGEVPAGLAGDGAERGLMGLARLVGRKDGWDAGPALNARDAAPGPGEALIDGPLLPGPGRLGAHVDERPNVLTIPLVLLGIVFEVRDDNQGDEGGGHSEQPRLPALQATQPPEYGQQDGQDDLQDRREDGRDGAADVGVENRRLLRLLPQRSAGCLGAGGLVNELNGGSLRGAV